jgi:hypothetical protein
MVNQPLPGMVSIQLPRATPSGWVGANQIVVAPSAAASAADRLRRHSVEQLWNAAPADDDGRPFVVWLAPFHNREAQEEVLREVEALSNRVMFPTFTAIQIAAHRVTPVTANPLTAQRQSSIARAMRMYGAGKADTADTREMSD